GAAAFWLGMRQARWMPRAFGLAMQVVAALVFFSGPDTNVSAWPFANPGFLGAMLVALPAAFTAWLLRRPLPHSDSRLARLYAAVEVQLSSPVFIFAFVFWCLGWALEIQRRLPPVELDAAAVAVFSMRTAGLLVMLEIVLSACLAMLLGLRTRWAVATWPARFSLPVMALALLVQGAAGGRVLHTPAWAIWPAVLVLHYWMLRKLDALPALWAQAPAPAGAALLPALTITRILHVGSAWLVTVLLADALWFWIGKGDLWSTSWAGVVLLVAAIAVLLFLAVWAGRASDEASRASFGWPRHPHAPVYYWHAALPLAALVFAGALAVALQSSGRTDPLPYIPLLNPTDLTLALALAALVFWRRVVVSATPTPPGFAWVRGPRALAAVAVLAFVAVNTVWLRVAHHFFGVSWDAGALFNSFVVQTGYAILWTLLALSLMVTAHRRVQRPLWLVGAGLLGLTVVKLLLVDLSNVGGAERIITFIVVGVLMLVVGYFAPLPPKTPAAPVPDGGQLPVSSTPLTPSTEAGLA
ncbi:MAG: hypothetical protein JWQ72_3043, partial [Polaromonas sp.]|nr:hypothetical protein [Polaromonas sp.]